MSNPKLDILFAQLISGEEQKNSPTAEELAEMLNKRSQRDAILHGTVARHSSEITAMQQDIEALKARRLAPEPVEKDWKFWGELALYGVGGALVGLAVVKTADYFLSDDTTQ